MSRDFLDDRRRALEEAFFAQQSDELIRRLRASDPGKSERDRLAEASGLKDPALLDRLVAQGIGSGTVAALSIVPLVVVAWADGMMGDRERRAVLDAAHAVGLDSGSDGQALLSRWLAQPPPAALLAAWTDYVHALGPEARGALRKRVMDRALQLAEAKGGLLGLLGGISAPEKAALARLEAALAS
ncbi:hypothetical protein [Roseomonas populi]|uniref:TerB family tellurite resistance protein n=1 Tax=Roseomonas populi TaxID=3121582 RepID=A0ABT1X1S3_9PROT|nr:hypothetical protein [Roseomonas pecuniae]MCR0982045.1 hypothetical protein [Roseomonas pecuniae]